MAIEGPAALCWKKSSWSAGNGSCVEIADMPGGAVAVRNSRDSSPGHSMLIFDSEEWSSFVADVQNGRFDLSD